MSLPLLQSSRRLLLAWALALGGCGMGDGGQGVDREGLRRVVASDERVVAALQGVDDLALKGKPGEAAALLASSARPASRESAAAAGALAPRSPWGKERHRELKALVDDRAASLDRYEAALKSDALEGVIAALEEQKTLDKRGAALAAAVAAPAP